MSEGGAEMSEQVYAKNAERGVGCANRGDSKTGSERTACKPKQSGGSVRFTCQYRNALENCMFEMSCVATRLTYQNLPCSQKQECRERWSKLCVECRQIRKHLSE